MAKPTKAAVTATCTTFRSGLDRATDLYERLALRGYTKAAAAEDPGRINQPDRRDVTQFVYFEAAALFEELVREMFSVEVRARFGVSPARAEYVMGSADRGLQGVMGWAAPETLVSRASNLFGKQGFHARLGAQVTQPTYDTLVHAHSVRNRIAHGRGVGKLAKKYAAALTWGHVPQAQRQGCGPGRFLHDYSNPAGTKFFTAFLTAYRAYADAAENALP